ncbi:MAG: YcxB family protein [Crocinitomicaceae bacterium]|nr:YcxB family protein [Crocinitomicaceae bacterium]
MLYTYKIEEADLLTFQLYTSSKSVVLEKKKRNGRFILVAASLAFGGYFLSSDEIPLGIYFCVMAIVSMVLYKRYFLWKHKLNYRRFIRANYSSRFGMTETLETFPTHIFVKDKQGEGEVKREEFEGVVEIEKYFFLKMKSGTSLIIPKAQVANDAFRNDLNKLKIPLVQELSWSWG